MNYNKIWKTLMVVLLCAGLISGCAKSGDGTGEKETAKKEQAKYQVVCTTFPQYDWVKEIIGEHQDLFDLTLLLDDGVDLHNYQPTAEDIAAISSCDLFIYVGGESDAWVEDALKNAENKNRKVMNMLAVLGDKVKEEEIVEGMQEEEHEHGEGDEAQEEEHEHDEGDEAQEEEHEHGEGDGAQEEEHEHDEGDEAQEEHEHGDEEVEYDEHVWLSLKQAKELVTSMTKTIAEMDSDNKESYEKTGAAYVSQLEELDKQYADVAEKAEKKTILFGDRFPFRYLAQDYGLSYYAAFAGCSAESEASFETITFLAGKVDELKLNTILVLEQADRKIAEEIKENTKDKKQEILAMNSLQSVTQKDIADGFTYIQAMQDNLTVLEQALR